MCVYSSYNESRKESRVRYRAARCDKRAAASVKLSWLRAPLHRAALPGKSCSLPGSAGHTWLPQAVIARVPPVYPSLSQPIPLHHPSNQGKRSTCCEGAVWRGEQRELNHICDAFSFLHLLLTQTPPRCYKYLVMRSWILGLSAFIRAYHYTFPIASNKKYYTVKLSRYTSTNI